MLSFCETVAFIFSIGHTPKHLVPAHLSFGELVINNLHPEKLIISKTDKTFLQKKTFIETDQ